MVSLDTPLCMMTLGQLLDAIDEYKYTAQLDEEARKDNGGLDVSTSIDELEFPVRLHNILVEMGCFTLEDILRLPPVAFKRAMNLGPKTYCKLEQILAKYGRKIGELNVKEDSHE